MNKNEEIKVGDVVYLNSGSPRLTVSFVRQNACIVRWLNEGQEQMMTAPTACFRSKYMHGRDS